MKTEIPNAQQSQQVLQLADLLARLVLVKPGTPVDLKDKPIFTDFLVQNRVAIIGIAVILPIDGGKGAQIVYLDGKEDASFQIPAIDPSSFDAVKWQPLPQGEVRREAANAVRHHAGDKNQPDSLRGYAATLQCLAGVVDPEALSPLEQSIASRYIHAGEFAWLCLLWLWTGELADDLTELNDDLKVTDNRIVVLEKLIDTKDSKGPLLLDKLCEHGLEAKLKQLYGSLKLGDRCWTLSSTRTQDFEKLGLILTSGDNSKQLSPKACVFTDWLCEAVKVLTSGEKQSSKCPHNSERLETLLNPSANTAWLSKLQDLAEKLNTACKTPDTAGWSEALNSLLNAFASQTERGDFRQTLRTEGFPVYPLVHMTMLFGLESPLDWLAIPLGAMMAGNGSAKKRDYWPQGAAFILAKHREPECVGELVTSLRPVLTEIAFAESSAGIQSILRQKEEQVEEYEDTVERIFEEFSGEEEPFIAKSSAMKTVMDAIDDYARTEVPVLLLGESGTGKTRLAEIIHKKSKRAGAFIRRNCADFEGQTGLSELRGHEKGVFTDAKDARDSIFVAKGGTVFLDEITCLPMPLQAMLLDAVEGRPIFAIGAQKGEPPDCRFIFATHANLDEMVSKGVFREDFLARIGNDAVIRCPALRERSDEIIPLFEVYFARALKTLGGQATKPSLPTEVVNALMGYAWPKNIRELAKVAFHAAVKAKRNNTTVVRLDMINDRLINKTNPVSPVAHNSRSIAQLSELRDPPLDESVSVIRIALHPKNTTGPATGWKKLKERNALAVLVAKLREKNLDLTFESLHERCGVSVPKLIEMEKCGKEQLAKVSTSGGQV